MIEPTELHENLQHNMKRYRKLLGLTQEELAERAGVSSGFIGEVEMCRKYPGPDTLIGIAKALGLKPFQLLMGPDDVTDAMGPEAMYETAVKIRNRIERELDDFVREADPRAAPQTRPQDGARDSDKRKRGR